MFFDLNDPKSVEEFGKQLGVEHLRKLFAQTVYVCWLSLPREHQKRESLEREVRRLVDEALNEFHESGGSKPSAHNT